MNQGKDRSVKTSDESFSIFECAPVFIATGISAFTLRELTESLRIVHPGSIQHHFWALPGKGFSAENATSAPNCRGRRANGGSAGARVASSYNRSSGVSVVDAEC